jgi:polyisoprenoid-binding protein YceI
MKTDTIDNKTKWDIDPSHSEIAFKVKHLMITNVKGVFREFGANISLPAGHFMTSEIYFWINPSSIETGDAKRDEHLRGSDFFDVMQYNKITFKGTSYEKSSRDGIYTLYGDLTIKNITKQISLDVEFSGVMKDPWGKEKAGYNINGKINRKDWSLNWNATLEAGGVLVGDEVIINCEVQLIKE